MRQDMRLRCWDKEKKIMLPSFPLYKSCFAHNDRTSDMIIMLGTGLTDRTGKEIYEGDVVEWPYYLAKKTRRGIVTWGIAGFWIPPYLDKLYRHDQMAVIGNIYEHPELVKSDG